MSSSDKTDIILGFKNKRAGIRMLKFFMMLALLTLHSWAQAITLEDFRRDTQEHRVRVHEYAALLIEKYPENFSRLYKLTPFERKRITEMYLALHDLPKIMKLDQLKKYNWGFNRTTLEELFDYYGKNCRPPCVNEMNRIENELKENALFKNFGYIKVQELELILNELKLAEEVADVTDTKMYRSEELGFKSQPRAAEGYFLQRGNKTAAQMSLWIEQFHKRAATLVCRRVVWTAE